MCLGIPGRIVEIVDVDAKLALAEFEGVRRRINVALVLADGQAPGDVVGAWVLVHVGFAMSVIDEQEAAETLATLARLGEVQAELAAMQASAPA
jgi:hydrogenase expression/formation protein HypC